MKIKIIRQCVVGYRVRNVGDVVDVHPSEGVHLISVGRATPVAEPETERATDPVAERRETR